MRGSPPSVRLQRHVSLVRSEEAPRLSFSGTPFSSLMAPLSLTVPSCIPLCCVLPQDITGTFSMVTLVLEFVKVENPACQTILLLNTRPFGRNRQCSGYWHQDMSLSSLYDGWTLYWGRRSRICFLMERGPQSANRAVNSAVLREHPYTPTLRSLKLFRVIH